MCFNCNAKYAGRSIGRNAKRLVQTAIGLLTLLAFPAAWPAQAQQPADTIYPEMARDQILPTIAHALKNVLIDPASVTNFSICYPPYRVKIQSGHPVRWVFAMLLNSKNSSGGYSGLTTMVAVFEPPKPVNVFASGPPDQKLLARCTHVPDAEIRQLIAAGS